MPVKSNHFDKISLVNLRRLANEIFFYGRGMAGLTPS